MFASYQIPNVTKRIAEVSLHEKISIVYLQQKFVSRAELLT